jgi:hypothetical protein
LRQQRLAELGIVGEIDAPARIAATCLEGIDLTLLHGGRQSREVAPDLLALRVMRFAQLAVKLPEERAQVQRFVEVRRQELEHGHAAVQVGRCRAALGRVTLRTLKLGRAALRALEVVAEQGREDLLAYVHVGFFALVEELGVGLEPAVPQRPYVRCSTLVGVALRLALAEVIGDPGELERNGERRHDPLHLVDPLETGRALCALGCGRRMIHRVTRRDHWAVRFTPLPRVQLLHLGCRP